MVWASSQRRGQGTPSDGAYVRPAVHNGCGVASDATRQEGSDECFDLLGDALRAEGVADHRPGPHEVHAWRQDDRRSDFLGQSRRSGQLLMQRVGRVEGRDRQLEDDLVEVPRAPLAPALQMCDPGASGFAV